MKTIVTLLVEKPMMYAGRRVEAGDKIDVRAAEVPDLLHRARLLDERDAADVRAAVREDVARVLRQAGSPRPELPDGPWATVWPR